jgi:DNA-binding CsgD family transcriptional regulator
MTTRTQAAPVTDSTFEASFAVDENQRILSWNRGAERLLGYPASSVVGKSCHEVLRGRDIFGNSYCESNCPLLKMARKGEPLHCLQLDVVDASDECRRVAVLPLVIPGPRPSEFTVLQILTPGPSADGIAPNWDRELTNREREVLRLLATGAETEQIAESLSIAPATARTHTQNLLKKLKVHSRSQAIALAYRGGYR